ncbi:MAG: 2-oxoacid:acceptor oxidoreductase family protein [Dehalococcoidia bacterium]|nr:2-oxoacid:acceptor oxidoreductase family protein [Dehalococcoidia bacterium]
MAKRYEAIFAGTGGRGVLTAGQMLTQVALKDFPHVLYFPSYGTEMRGGTSECTVVLSESPIGSPVLTQSNVLVIFDITQLQAFENRIKPGGLLILESSTLENGQNPTTRKDIKTLNVPALKIAGELGDIRTISQVLLGAYVQATGVMPADVIEVKLKERFTEKGLTKVIDINIKAFREGLKAAKGGK